MERYHLGRVVAVGKDYCSICQSKGAVTIKMQRLLRRTDLSQEILTAISSPVLENEVFLVEDAILFLPESSVIFRDQANITLDYIFASSVELSLQQQALQEQQHQTHFI